jgi:ELWxxDGT repeat protein
MKISIVNMLMSGSRYAALALTVITSLAAGLWVSNAVAVVKVYHTDSGGYNWVCGAGAPPVLYGILTENPTCSSDTLAIDGLASAYAGTWNMETPYTHDTMVKAVDFTVWLDDSDLSSPLAIDARMSLFVVTSSGGYSERAQGNISTTHAIGANTINFSSDPFLVEAGSYLYPQLYIRSSDSGSFIRLGTNFNSISFTIDEKDALCTLPVTDLSLSDVSATSRTLTWTASSPNSDEYNVYRNGSLIGTVTEQSFTDNINTGQFYSPDITYNYVVKNSNTSVGCEGPDASLTIYTTSDNAEPVSHDFVEVLVKETGTETFIISNNTGSGPITVNGVMLSGTWIDFYNITSNSSCTLDTVLEIEESCTVEITFAPLSDGLKDARLVVTFDDVSVPITVIPLQGGLRPYLVEDIYPSNSTYSPFNNIVDVNGTAYFDMNDGLSPRTLWKSDGTDVGTKPVRDINSPINPYGLFAINNSLFFSAYDRTHGYELWASDGTEENTRLVKDINPGPVKSDSGSNGLGESSHANVNGVIFFPASDGTHGRELWKSDGTEAGTVLVKDISPPYGGFTGQGSPQNLTDVNGTLFFTAEMGSGINSRDLWKSDGTEAGTVLVKVIGAINDNPPDNLVNVNGTLFFTADDDIHGTELWKSDGTNAGTVMVKDINGGTSGSSANYLTNLNGVLFFSAYDHLGAGRELWKSDGTEAGTVLVEDITPGLGSDSRIDPNNLTNVNGKLFFRVEVAYADGGGYDLWQSDGTAEGTALVKKTYSYTSEVDHPRFIPNVNGKVFFSMYEAGQGRELWESNGTPEGTFRVMDINPGNDSSNPQHLTQIGDSLFFMAYTAETGNELWAYKPSNASPTITQISDQDTYDNNPIGPLSFTISDKDTSLQNLVVTVSSSNSTLLANTTASLEMTGEGAERTLTLTPEPSATGTTIVTITVDDVDGNQQTTSSFVVEWWSALVV